MLESEKAELEAHEAEDKERQRQEKRDRLQRRIRQQLFGKQGSLACVWRNLIACFVLLKWHTLNIVVQILLCDLFLEIEIV